MKFEIKLGPAGTPGSSTLEGVSKIKELGLQCMEVQFSHGIGMKDELAKKIGKERERVGIDLSLHAPFFINLASKDAEKLKASKKRILVSCEKGHYMGAKEIVFHPAYFGGDDKEKIYQMTKEHILDMVETVKKNKWNCVLTPETTGKHSALGSLDETIRMVKETGCSLCVDFAHLYARNHGKIDYGKIFDKLKVLKLKHLHCHFSNIEYTMKGERRHLVLDGKPPFEPLARELIKRKMSATIISESPVTWEDSLKMKKIFEKLGYIF